MEGTYLFSAAAKGANFSGSYLDWAWLSGINAPNADFSKSSMCNTVLDKGDFTGSDFTDTDFDEDVCVVGTVFTQAKGMSDELKAYIAAEAA